jgi:Tol biopolymer transport system component
MPRLRSISTLLAAALTAAACSDTTAPPANNAIYDLLYESMASPLENQSQLFLLRDGETTPTPVLGGNNFAAQPRISADGRWVAYMAPRPGDTDNSVWLARTDGTDRRAVFTTSGETLLWPVPSPDGSRIAFQAADTVSGSSRIWVVSANGTSAGAITTEAHDAPFVYSAPNWSPDGTRIALAMGTPGNLRLATMSAEGGPLTTVTQPASGSDTEPHWSPDGTQLVFAHTISPALSSLVIVTLATGVQRTLFTGNAHNPAWSPTRDLIAFSARQPIESAELFVIPAVGGTAQRITTNEVPDRYPNWVRRTP